MKKRQVIIILSIIGIIVISLVIMMALNGMAEESKMHPAKEKIIYVKTEKVNYTNIESYIAGSGRLASQSLVDVSAEVQGKILQGNVPLKKGQTFKKGDVMLRIYNEEFKLALRAKKSRFLTLIANILPDLKVDFNSSFDKWNLFFDNINPEKNLPELPEINEKKEKIFLASRNILSEYYSIKSDELRLVKYSIRAPFTGVYSQVYSEVGSIANPGARLGQILRTDKLELEVPIDINEVKWLQTGDNVELASENDIQHWQGKIIRIAEYVDPTTQAISVFVRVSADKKNPLYNGQYLNAIFKGKIIKNSFSIPRNAVYNFNEVYVVINDKLQKRIITVEKVNKDNLVFNGLPQGVDIVIEPLMNIAENTVVEILN